MPDTTEGYRILIVDDSPDILQLLTMFFDGFATCETADSVASMLSRLACGLVVSAVVLDLHLPNGQGTALVEQVTSKFPQVPVIAISGYEFSRLDIIKAGAQDFLPKQDFATNPKRLLDAVTEAIARHRITRESARGDKQLNAIKETVQSTVNRLEENAPPFSGRPSSSKEFLEKRTSGK